MQMKKFLLLLLGMTFIFAVTAPILAQQSGTGTHIFTSPIRILEPRGDNTHPSGYPPVQMRAAYRYNVIPNQGQGMTIGIVDACDYPSAEADLGVFSTYYYLPACTTANGCFTKIQYGGTLCSGHSGNWAIEQALDIQWAHAMAPAAKIVLVENAQADDTLFLAVDQAVAAGSNVVSMSWGYGGGFNGETAEDFHFQVPGVTFFSATGDSGCLTNYPAESPYVVAVGGTVLTLLSALPPPNPFSNNYGHEIAWSGSGGGISIYESEPTWQMGVQHSGFRSIPDVALDASPSSGVPVYDSYDGYQWLEVGGTSLSSPVWAAFMAIENSLRVAGGGTTIHQFLPDLYQTIYPSGNYALDFHDVTTGSSGGICVAGSGYDYVTGVGTPIANHLANDLVPLP
jgi:subtilase family serine protease